MPRLLWLLVVAGCSSRVHHVPLLRPEGPEGDWSVTGRVRAEDCSIYLLFVDWTHLFGSDRAFVEGLGPRVPWRPRTPEERRALYAAVQQLPDADHLLPPRSHVETVGVALFGRPLFGERCAGVDVTGVRFGTATELSGQTPVMPPG